MASSEQASFRRKSYKLIERISFHQNREVFRAQNAFGEPVILKRLQMGQLSDWKPMELFEREVKTLQTLQHQRIPQLLDYFHETSAGQVSLTMVMQQIEGPNLAQRLQTGWRPKESEVIEIARQGFEILKYLHNHEPAVIHRDIKPSNLIWTDQAELFLIDFGAVRDIFIAKGSSTVIGTFGYMAPEQFSGQTLPASDLYSLGATLLHLLAGRAPGEMPQKHLMPDFRPYVSCSLELQRLLEALMVPDLEERLPSAEAALEAIQALSYQRERSPSGRLLYLRNADEVQIQLEPSFNPINLWQQHAPLLSVLLILLLANSGFVGILIRLVSIGSFSANDQIWGMIVWNYVIFSNILMLFAIFQFINLAGEAFKIKLLPEQMQIQFSHAPEPIQIPKSAIFQVTRRVDKVHTKLSRLGVSLSLKSSEGNNNQVLPEFLTLSDGLGKKDQHWLMTKLLLYTYQTSQNPGGYQQ